ncbi:MAG: hypothetical protein ACREJ0_23555 [Geminicoccaceae bacterium]
MTWYQFLLVDRRAAVVLATVAVASCTSSSHSVQQVRASNPSVTYEYTGDEELLQAQQNAAVFCSQYQSAPLPARITSGSSGGSNHVVFECDPNLPPAAAPQEVIGSDLTYYYRTDQELLDASRSAQAYCTDNGWQQAVPSVRTNTDGSRTVLFQCT